jgi:hypothetical protein
MKEKTKNYWTEVEECEIRKYLLEPNSDASKESFNNIIYPALKTLVQNIMYTYQLFDSIRPISEQVDDTLSFLMEKFNRFDPSRKTKAFSYYGTIAKRYMMANKIKNQENKTIEIDDLDGCEIENNVYDYNYYDKDESSICKFIEILHDNIEKEFSQPNEYGKNTKIISETVLYFLKNYTDVNLINKNYFYFLCKERTGLKTKEITKGLKVIREIFDRTLSEFV